MRIVTCFLQSLVAAYNAHCNMFSQGTTFSNWQSKARPSVWRYSGKPVCLLTMRIVTTFSQRVKTAVEFRNAFGALASKKLAELRADVTKRMYAFMHGCPHAAVAGMRQNHQHFQETGSLAEGPFATSQQYVSASYHAYSKRMICTFVCQSS